MQKRKRSDDAEAQTYVTTKRTRLGPRLGLLHLSDEVLLRILSHLSIKQLMSIETCCHRLRQLANDSEIWRSKFYHTWIEARIRRAPPHPTSRSLAEHMNEKTTKWLEHGRALRRGGIMDWKRQFKIRKNWCTGAAKVQEIEIAKLPTKAVHARVHQGSIFTVDTFAGLRVWSNDGYGRQAIAQIDLQVSVEPTSLAVDSQGTRHTIAVGYADGSFSIFSYQHGIGFKQKYRNSPPQTDALTTVALMMPYILTMNTTGQIQLYVLQDGISESSSSITLLSSLHSENVYKPVSLSIRKQKNILTATIAYSFNRLNAGWCIGLQEIRLSDAGGILNSRLTSTIETPMDAKYRGVQGWEMSSRSASSTPFALHPHLMSAPTALSYSHPFLIASLNDNTIMSYIITSNDDKLEINTGRRLWGHTSAVSGAEVSNQGKAVSVSARGHEIRIWELEDILTSTSQKRTSIQIKPGIEYTDLTRIMALRGNGLGLAFKELKDELATTRRWVDFDDEQVVVLVECDTKQILSCYDFA